MLKQAKAIPTANATAEPPRMTYQRFLEQETDRHVEWVDGRVVELSPITVAHDDLTTFFVRILGEWVERQQVGQLRKEPFQMKTGPKLPGRSPDVMFISKRSAQRLKDTYLDGPADLVIEVISKGSRSVDRGAKYFEYETGGVKEYWLIDPDRRQAEFYRLGRDRVYHLVPIGDDDLFHSQVLKGLWLKVGWLWQKPLPTVASVLKTWKLG
jgi:Uma2 family endonuclease